MTALRCVIVAGEECLPELVADHAISGLDARLFNEYGPTECTVWCAVAELRGPEPDAEAARGPVSIGGPIPGARLVIRDANNNPVPPDLPGELLVGGGGLAEGYLNLPDETSTRFIEDTHTSQRLYRTGDLVRQNAQGELIFLGRTDEQIKLRGYRIELSEIEAGLSGRPDVREAAVQLFGVGSTARLVGFIVAKDGALLSPDDLTKRCREIMPEYMVPSQFVTLAALPRTPNGKIDRKALAEPKLPASASEYVAPSTQIESVLEELWRQTLWVDRKISVNEDFYDLGGHSLLAMRLVNEIEQVFEIRIPLARMGKMTTIANHAVLIEEVRREGSEAAPSSKPKAGIVPNILAGFDEEEERKLRSLAASWQAKEARPGSCVRVLNETGTLPPLFFCFLDEYSFTQLAKFMGEDQPIYGIRGANMVVPMTGEDAFEDNMRRAALSYVDEVIELADGGPILLGGYCQGATIALHLAAILTAVGQRVSTVITLEKTPPVTYPGHVDIIFTEDSFLNPYRTYERPELAWSRRYGSHSFQIVPGDYGKAFVPPYVADLSKAIREMLDRAKKSAPPALPREARSIEWETADIPATIAPGEIVEFAVTFQNTGPSDWDITEKSGLRLRADVFGQEQGGAPVATSHSEIQERVEAGGRGSVPLRVEFPREPGSYRVEIDIVEEGLMRFSKVGNSILSRLVIVDPDAEALDQKPTDAAAMDEDGQQLIVQAKRLSDVTKTVFRREAGKPLALDPVKARLSTELAKVLHELGLSHLRKEELAEADRVLHAVRAVAPEDGVNLVALARVRMARHRYLSGYLLLKKAERMGAADATSILSMLYTPRGAASGIKRWLKSKRTMKEP